MATTVQLLSELQSLSRYSSTGAEYSLNSYNHGWTVTNGNLELTGSEVDVISHYTLRIYPDDATPVTVSLSSIILQDSDINRLLGFNAKLKCATEFSASVTLSIFNGSSYPATTGIETIIDSGTFSAVRSNVVTVGNIPDGEDYNQAQISIVISGHQGQNVHLTLPNLIHDFAFYSNDFVAASRQYLPDFYWEKDGDAESPDYPFFRLIDILTSAASDVKRESERMYGVETDEFLTDDEHTQFTSLSTLVSPFGVREEYSSWLSQFNGEKIYRNFQDADGNLYFDNPSIQRDFLQWQLSTGHYGRSAGTRRAMIEAVQQVLVKTKDGGESTRSVAITPQYLGEPFTILVQTLENETIDADVGQSSYLVEQSVALAKPLGYSIVHSTETEFFFTLDSPSLGVLDELRWG